MTTSILSPENSALVLQETRVPAVQPAGFITYRIRHTLASRFAFLIVCVAIILSALAYGMVHYWALAGFLIGGAAILVLWLIDSWNLGSFRLFAGRVSTSSAQTSGRGGDRFSSAGQQFVV